ncbi:hypothetical protein L0668_17835 [Paraglaciecola aquimarina]|uniref:Uncharacterized protein n=1 Tax=Paraglaciecola algarum TaxID=3050085 RepID=A0ABS9DB89_9ALTE|nr:hypothetical protein [Paraglaciecola sp. G1-23]MCF2949984.1 hypothetical protein [Paraglaciecola sp. G1-23]
MKKRTTISNRRSLSSNSRRRQLLKRVHQKVVSRRQSFQVTELNEDLAEAC